MENQKPNPWRLLVDQLNSMTSSSPRWVVSVAVLAQLLSGCSKGIPKIVKLAFTDQQAVTLVQNAREVDELTSNTAGEFQFDLKCTPSTSRLEYSNDDGTTWSKVADVDCATGTSKVEFHPNPWPVAGLLFRTAGEWGHSDSATFQFKYGGNCSPSGFPLNPINNISTSFTANLGTCVIDNNIRGFVYKVGPSQGLSICDDSAYSGSEVTSLDSKTLTSKIAEGPNTLCLRYVTKHGVLVPAENAIMKTFTYDRTAPTVSIANTAISYVRNGNQGAYSITGSCNDPTGKINLVVTDGSKSVSGPSGGITCSSNLNWSTTLDVSSLSEGSTIAIKAKIYDLAGNASSEVTIPGITKDTQVPKIVSVVPDGTVNGQYNAGKVIGLKVNWSEPVKISLNGSGGPKFKLNTTPQHDATLLGANVNSTSLETRFTYTVLAGENSADLDAASTTALLLNSSSIEDAYGNPADLNLPTPGSSSSLSGVSNIIIDTQAPDAFSIAGITATGTSGTDDLSSDGYLTQVSGISDVKLNFGVSNGAANYDVTLYTVPSGGTAKCTYTNQLSSGVLALAKSVCFSGGGDLNSNTSYYIELLARDAAGNPVSASNGKPGGRFQFSVDTQAPGASNIRLTSGSDSDRSDGYLTSLSGNSIEVKFNSSNANAATVRIRKQGDNSVVCGPVATSSLSGTDDYITLTGCNLSSETGYKVSIDLSLTSPPKSNLVEWPFTFDTTAPTLAITTPSVGSYVNSSNKSAFTISGSCSENNRNVEIFYGSTSLGSVLCNISINPKFTKLVDLSGLADNNTTGYSLTAKQKDASGLTGISAGVTIFKDTLPPTSTLAGTPSSPTSLSTLDITVNGTDVTAYKYKFGSGASPQCAIINGAYVGEVPVTTHITSVPNPYSDGSYYLCVLGRDAGGNWQSDASATSLTWVKDSTGPTIAKVLPLTSAGYYKAGSVIQFEIQWSENVWMAGTSPSVSMALNISPTIRNATLDGSNDSTESLYTILTYTVGSGDISSDLDYVNTAALSLAGGTIKDAAGNNASLTLPIIGGGSSLGDNAAYVIDTQAPDAFSLIGIGTPAGTGADRNFDGYLTKIDSANVELSYNSAPGASSYDVVVLDESLAQRCSLNGAANPIILARSICFPTITDHTIYYIEMTAKDTAGNTTLASNAKSSGRFKIEIDATAPSIAIANPTSGSFINIANNNNSYLVNGSCSEAGKMVSLYVDGSSASSATTTCDTGSFTTTLDVTTGAQGAHSIVAKITDAAGWVGSSVPITVTKDTVAPTLTLSSPVENSTITTNTMAFSATCVESGNVSILINTAVVASQACNTNGAVSGTVDISSLSNQTSFTVSAAITDSASNTTTLPGLTVTKNTTPVDTEAPVMGTLTMENTSTSLTESPVVSWASAAGDVDRYEIKMDSGSYSSVGTALTYQFTGLSLSDSTSDHTIKVRAIDGTGNISNEASATWKTLQWPTNPKQIETGFDSSGAMGSVIGISESGKYMVVAAGNAAGASANSVYFYAWNTSLKIWELKQTLTSTFAVDALSISENATNEPKIRIVAGNGNATNTNASTGNIWVYQIFSNDLSNSGTSRFSTVTLPTLNSDGGLSPNFGFSVLAIGDYIYIGAPGKDSSSCNGSGGSWTEQDCGRVYFASDAAGNATYDLSRSANSIKPSLSAGESGFKFGIALARGGDGKVWVGARAESRPNSEIYSLDLGSTSLSGALILGDNNLMNSLAVENGAGGSGTSYLIYSSDDGINKKVNIRKCSDNTCVSFSGGTLSSSSGAESFAIRKQNGYPTLLAVGYPNQSTPKVDMFVESGGAFSLVSPRKTWSSSSGSLMGAGLGLGLSGNLIIGTPSEASGKGTISSSY